MCTKVLRDVGTIEGLVEVPEAAEVGVEALAVAQLYAVSDYGHAAWLQHARHFRDGLPPDVRRQLVEQVHAVHLHGSHKA